MNIHEHVATKIGGVQGEHAITKMWKDHFENLLNSSLDVNNLHVTSALKNGDMIFVRNIINMQMTSWLHY